MPNLRHFEHNEIGNIFRSATSSQQSSGKNSENKLKCLENFLKNLLFGVKLMYKINIHKIGGTTNLNVKYVIIACNCIGTIAGFIRHTSSTRSNIFGRAFTAVMHRFCPITSITLWVYLHFFVLLQILCTLESRG